MALAVILIGMGLILVMLWMAHKHSPHVIWVFFLGFVFAWFLIRLLNQKWPWGSQQAQKILYPGSGAYQQATTGH